MADNLKRIFGDILKGMSPFYFKPIDKEIYIRHATPIDNCDIDNVYNGFFEKAVSKKLPTEKFKLEYLDKKGLWTTKQQKELDELARFVATLRVTKTKMTIPSQREAVEAQIIEQSKKVQKLESEKDELVGLTAELYATKQMNEYYLRNSTFKDKKATELLYNNEEYDDLDGELTLALVTIYNEFNELFCQRNIKKVALIPLFLNSFYLCQDNPYIYYGKPVVDLTIFQADLFGFGRLFKNIISENHDKIPEIYLGDPDKLLDWHESTRNAEKIMEKQPTEGVAVSLVGASKADYEKLGMGNELKQSNQLFEKAKQKGGKLSMKDLIAMQG